MGYRSFVRNVVVQIPKFDSKSNPNPNKHRKRCWYTVKLRWQLNRK